MKCAASAVWKGALPSDASAMSAESEVALLHRAAALRVITSPPPTITPIRVAGPPAVRKVSRQSTAAARAVRPPACLRPCPQCLDRDPDPQSGTQPDGRHVTRRRYR